MYGEDEECSKRINSNIFIDQTTRNKLIKVMRVGLQIIQYIDDTLEPFSFYP